MKFINKKRIPEPNFMSNSEEESFNRFMKKNIKRLYYPFVDIVYNKSKISKGNIIDFGCGSGFLVKALSVNKKNIKIIGIDNSETMLKKAKLYCKVNKNIVFRKENVEKTSFKDSYANIIVSKDSFHEFVNARKALKEMFRVLKPGGYIFIFDLKRNMPWKYKKIALNKKNIFQKIQYNSLLASYTSSELQALIKLFKPAQCLIVTKKVTKSLKKKYKNIDPSLLRQGFQTRNLVILKK